MHTNSPYIKTILCIYKPVVIKFSYFIFVAHVTSSSLTPILNISDGV